MTAEQTQEKACVMCGAALLDTASICSRCGAKRHGISEGFSELPNASCSLVGVGGWLLWLCIGTTIITPLSFVAEGQTATSAAEQVIAYTVAGFSFVTGLSLWTRRSYALSLAGAFLVAVFLLSALSLLASAMTKDYEANSVSLSAITWAFVWFLYLSRSVRIRHTYGRNLGAS
jgi:hypothetical protein